MVRIIHKKSWFAFFLAMPILFLASTFLSYHEMDNQFDSRESRVANPYQLANEQLMKTGGVPVIAYKEGTEEQVKKKVKELHTFYNELLGWGAVAQFKVEEVDFKNHIHEISSIQNLLKKCLVHHDLTNMKKLLEQALQDHDRLAVVYAHRIIHDLDVELNKEDSADGGQQTVWGVTISFGEHTENQGDNE